MGQNYFCEAVITKWDGHITETFWPNDDPLWDRQGCGPTSTCCTFNSPPWFNVQLSSPTTVDIEVRICGNEGIGNEGSPIILHEMIINTVNELRIINVIILSSNRSLELLGPHILELHMWQSRVEIEGFSIAYFNRIAVFEAPYR